MHHEIDILTCDLSAYWNEARILDPVTFNTITSLPNIPGSVNNCKSQDMEDCMVA